MDRNHFKSSRFGSANDSAAKTTLQEPVSVKTTKMITRFVNNLKLCTRTCVREFSERCQLPSELNKLLNTLDQARVVAIKMSPLEPAIHRADKLEKLMSEALSLTRKFRGVRVCSTVYASVERVKHLLTPSVRMVRGIIGAIKDTMTDSEDETDSEDGSEFDSESDSDSESESDSEDSSCDDDSHLNKHQSLNAPQSSSQINSSADQEVTPIPQTAPMPPQIVPPPMASIPPISPMPTTVVTPPMVPASPIAQTPPMVQTPPTSPIVMPITVPPPPIALIPPTVPESPITPMPPVSLTPTMVPTPPMTTKPPISLKPTMVAESPVAPITSIGPTSAMTPMPPMQMPQPRRPEECKTEMTRRLSELLWKTREEVENKQKKGILSSTKRSSRQGFKRQGSLIHSQVKETFSKCSEKMTASKISSLMGDLVKPHLTANRNKLPVNVTMPAPKVNQSSEPPNLVIKSVCQVSQDHTYSSTDLVKYFDTTLNFLGVRNEFTQLMCGVTDQLSESSISALSSHNNTVGTPCKELRDGSVKFLLRPSPLTKVLEQRKKEGKPLTILKLDFENCLTQQPSADKSMNPIKKSILTTKVKDTDVFHHHAKVFALKMQQSLLTMVGSQSRRVILTARRAKKINTLSSRPVSSHPIIENTSNSIGFKLSLVYSVSTSADKHVQTMSKGILGKHHLNYIDFEDDSACRKKFIKTTCTYT